MIVQAGALSPDPTPKALAFFASLVIKPGLGSPLDGTPQADGSSVPTNVLDFALARKGESYTLRDDAFQIAFPARPEVTIDRSLPQGAMAVQAEMYTGERETYEATMFLVPKDVTYDSAKGVQGTRDALLKAAEVKHPEEMASDVGGLPGKRIRGNGKYLGSDAFFEAEIVWDPGHRAVVSAVTITNAKATTPLGRAFLDSLAIHASGHTPH